MSPSDSLNFGTPASEMFYIVFCRILGIKDLKVEEIAGMQQVLFNLAKELSSDRHQSSVYGRIYFLTEATLSIRMAESLLKRAAGNGVRLAIGVSMGRLLPTTDLGLECLQGPAISTAARLASLSEAEDGVVVWPHVYDLVAQSLVSLGYRFDREMDGQVKQTKLKYRILRVSSGGVSPRVPPFDYQGPSEGQVVVYDIAGFSQLDEDGQSELVQRLQSRVREVANTFNLSARVQDKTIWYAPAGDGGALIFSGNQNALTAFEVAKALSSACRDSVNLRVGVAGGMIAVVGSSLPVGKGVLRADQCSGCPPTGGIAVDKRYWDVVVPDREKNAWRAAPAEKDTEALLLTPKLRSEDRATMAAGMVIGEASASVRKSLEQYPKMRTVLAEALHLSNTDEKRAIAELANFLLNEDLNKILKVLWGVAKSPNKSELKEALEAMMSELSKYGIKEDWLREARSRLMTESGELGGGLIPVPLNIWMPSAEIIKAAIFDGPCQWAKVGEDGAKGENIYVGRQSTVEPASPDSIQRMKELQTYVLRKARQEHSTGSRNARIEVFLEAELEEKTPFYLLLGQGDPLLDRLLEEDNSPWKHALTLVRSEAIPQIFGKLEKTEEYIRRILTALATLDH